MNDFVAVLNFFRDCFLMLFDLDIPLGSDLAIKWGAIVLGLMALPLFLKVLFRLFSDAGSLAENQSDKSKSKKGG